MTSPVDYLPTSLPVYATEHALERWAERVGMKPRARTLYAAFWGSAEVDPDAPRFRRACLNTEPGTRYFHHEGTGALFAAKVARGKLVITTVLKLDE